MNGKNFAWLKERFTVLLGRPPEEHELDRLMKVKENLGIDYDDPVILQLLALEYYSQLYEQVPDRIRTVIEETEVHAGKHFEQEAAQIARQQASVITGASQVALDKLVETANKMIAGVGSQARNTLTSVISDQFDKVVRPDFFRASQQATMAAREISDFSRMHWRWIVWTSMISGFVSALVVLGLVYWVWGRA